jgi:general secretion pathway protein C
MNWSVMMRELINKGILWLTPQENSRPLDVQPIVFALNVVLVAGLGLLCARVLWLLVEPTGTVAPVVLPIAGAKNGSGSNSVGPVVDRTRLVRDDFFGSPLATESVVEDAPESTLNLKLVGSRMTTEASAGMAMIVTPDNKTGRYYPGDTLIDGVTLVSVMSDRVLISKNGAIESLYLSSAEGELSVLATAEDGQTVARATPNRQGATTGVLSVQAFGQVSFAPIERDGTLAGYRVSNRNSGQDVLSSAGLRSGDIIVGLDGSPIYDFEPADVLDRLSGGSSATLSIERDGRVFELSLKSEAGR